MATPNEKTAILCEKITKHYQKGDNLVTPLDNLDLIVEKGHFLCLMGPSGSGKSTLLNLISGVDSPSSGKLWVNGQEISNLGHGKLTCWRRDNVGYIFQLYHLIPVLTAYENVELPLLIQPLTARERKKKVELALNLVGLDGRDHHYPRELSGGQEQRVAIARAIVADPPLLVADEPTGDLDREAAVRILELLKQLRDELKKTIVMVTHDPHAAEHADKILHLEKGQLLEKQKLKKQK